MICNAIPTVYAGVQFRSRIEAKWAAFFDLLRWSWEYEPIDLAGYIPDFILTFSGEPLLVEVKADLSLSELQAHSPKIEASGWEHEALIVGAKLFEAIEYPGATSLGLLAERCLRDYEKPESGMDWAWSTSTIGPCVFGREGRKGSRPNERYLGDDHWGLSHDTMSYTCRVCGQNDGNPVRDDDDSALRAFWRQAANIVQWKGPRK